MAPMGKKLSKLRKQADEFVRRVLVNKEDSNETHEELGRWAVAGGMDEMGDRIRALADALEDFKAQENSEQKSSDKRKIVRNSQS